MSIINEAIKYVRLLEQELKIGDVVIQLNNYPINYLTFVENYTCNVLDEKRFNELLKPHSKIWIDPNVVYIPHWILNCNNEKHNIQYNINKDDFKLLIDFYRDSNNLYKDNKTHWYHKARRDSIINMIGTCNEYIMYKELALKQIDEISVDNLSAALKLLKGN